MLGPLDKSIVGVMRSLSGAFAAADILLLAISTFDIDYVLVRKAHLEVAIAAWRARVTITRAPCNERERILSALVPLSECR